jgi:bacterioferritin-associated ferredoxin
MDVVAKSPFQSEITLKSNAVHVIGSMKFIEQVNALKLKFGLDPKMWPPLDKFSSSDDLILNEFILKCRGEFKLNYAEIELCHCRMVPAERVYNAIKQGARTVDDICRTTLAGTGCGSCRPDSQILLDQFKIS